MNNATDPLMTLEDLRYAYHGRHYVVDGVCATVQPGRLHVLLGPNACGKTTLLKLMLGMLKPARGKVLMDGRSVHRLSAVKRASWLGYVPQKSSTGFTYSVGHVVSMGRFALPWSEKEFQQVMIDCQLEEIADWPFVELSAGQQQRVLLARGLFQCTNQGQVMLLDEPISAMDLEHVHRTMKQLVELIQKGMAVIVVLHDINLAARYADDVWLMDKGEIVADGSWSQVLTEEVLSPIYKVHVQQVETTFTENDRPLFDIQLPHGT